MHHKELYIPCDRLSILSNYELTRSHIYLAEWNALELLKLFQYTCAHSGNIALNGFQFYSLLAVKLEEFISRIQKAISLTYDRSKFDLDTSVFCLYWKDCFLSSVNQYLWRRQRFLTYVVHNFNIEGHLRILPLYHWMILYEISCQLFPHHPPSLYATSLSSHSTVSWSAICECYRV